MRSTLLPIEALRTDIESVVAAAYALFLHAEPGAGKTTEVPFFLLNCEWRGDNRILLLEPRRVAAIGAAEFMSEQLGESAGGLVGYRTRAAQKVSERTRIEVITEGILTRMLLDDPALSGYAAVIFDEFHERSLHSDLGLALCLESQETLRPDLRIVVMSATLEVDSLKSIVPHAAMLSCPGRSYAVEVVYQAPEKQLMLEENVAVLTQRALRENEGDVLVFLPGAREIRKTKERLEAAVKDASVDILSFSGESSLDEQRRILRRAQEGRRRVILSTNIAETSVTIDGIRSVVDSGFMRIAEVDHARGMSELVTVRVSQASATQRAGRAGRLAPGRCYRLWREAEHAHLAKFNEPEILHSELSSFLLDAAAWGASSIESLKLVTQPPAAAISEARALLLRLKAIDTAGRITASGRRLSTMGVHPRLGNMIVHGQDEGLAGEACDLAALLEERDPLRSDSSDISVSARWHLLNDQRSRQSPGSDRGALGRAIINSNKLRARLRVATREKVSDHRAGDRLGYLVALAYPDRIAKRRSKDSVSYLLSNGSGALLPQASMLSRHEFLAVASLTGSGANARIHLAEPLSESDLDDLGRSFGEAISETVWDESSGSVRGTEDLRIGAITLRSKRSEISDELAFPILANALRAKGLDTLSWSKEAKSLLNRNEWARKRSEGRSLPDLSDEWLAANVEIWLLSFVPGARSLATLKQLNLLSPLAALLSHQQRVWLDSFAPAYLSLVTGTQAWIQYGDAPSISVALQEMFGTSETPRIGNGTVPLTIELLSPAKRPLQVTKDLASFWSSVYPKLRSEMRAKYPRHSWPENPRESAPVRGPKRRR